MQWKREQQHLKVSCRKQIGNCTSATKLSDTANKTYRKYLISVFVEHDSPCLSHYEIPTDFPTRKRL